MRIIARSPTQGTKPGILSDSLAMADNTPLSTVEPSSTGQQNTLQTPPVNRQQSKEMVDDVHHPHIVDEDPLLISQTLTYVTDDGSVVHSFHSAPFSFGMYLILLV